MVILRATSILEGQKKDKWMMCSITPKPDMSILSLHWTIFAGLDMKQVVTLAQYHVNVNLLSDLC